MKFIDVANDLVATIWTDRPANPSKPIDIHDLKYAGENWKSKLDKTIAKIKETGSDMFVVTALDEVACNLTNFKFNYLFNKKII